MKSGIAAEWAKVVWGLLLVVGFTAAARAQGQGGVGADGTEIQLARWDVILNDNATESIEAVDSKMIETKSAVYHAELFNADALRAGINAAAAAGGLEGASQGMAHTQSFGPGGFYMQPLYFNYMMGGTAHVSLNGNANGNESITSDGADKLHVQLNYSQIDGRIYETANGRQNSANLDKKASISFDGQIAAGDALTMSATIKGKSGTSYRHMIVWEVFKAEQQFQQNYQQIQDSQRWCQIGPAGIRHAAQVAAVWAGGATHPALQVGEKWEKKLDDGKIIRLTGITRSDKWLYCWWDADGNPLANTNNELGFVSFVKYYADRPVWFAAQVSGSEDEWKKQFPTGHPSRNFGQQSGSFTTSIATVSDQNGTATVGVPVGDWEKISEIGKGQTIKVGATTYRLQDIQSMGDEGVYAQFYVQRGDPTGGGDLVTLSVVKKDGTEVDTDYVQMITGKNYGTPEPQFQGVKLADVKSFEVWRRKHQWVTFSGFATEPVKPPNDQVTDADLTAALAAQKQQQFQAQVEAAKKQVEALAAKRKEWEAIAADPTTPKGALRAMFAAAGKGDLKSVRARLKSSQANSQPLLDAVARVITSTQAARVAAVARFGEANVLALQGNGMGGQPILVDLEAQMMQETWTPRDDGGLQANDLALIKGDDGQFYLDLGMPKKNGGEDLSAMVPMFVAMSMRAEQISQMLKDNPSMTFDQFSKTLGAPLAVTQEAK